jgi:hypothetical protein
MTTIDFSGKHLGRLEAKHDPAVPMLMSLISGADSLPPPPEHSNWYQAVAEWPMDNNDTVADCTSAAAAHAIQQWTLYGAGTSLIMQAAAVLAFYQLTKVPDGEGAYLLDVMKYWMAKGVNTGVGVHKIDAFATIHPSNTQHARCAVAWFGNVIIGLALPVTAQSQDVWMVVSGSVASGAGSWGGHCVLVVGYDRDFIYFVSWGRVMRMSWGFYETYCDEAYVAITRDWMKPPGTAPSGFSYDGLRHAMKTLAAAG